MANYNYRNELPKLDDESLWFLTGLYLQITDD